MNIYAVFMCAIETIIVGQLIFDSKVVILYNPTNIPISSLPTENANIINNFRAL